MNNNIIVTGGGSGGHIQSAFGLIDLYSNEEKKQICFVGGTKAMEGEKNQQSLEQKISGQEGVSFRGIRSGKLQRHFHWRTLIGLMGIVGGFVDAWYVIRKIKPKLVISFGGYVTVPVVLVAKILKIPVFVHEQTTRVGLANKIAGRVAKKIFISFLESAQYFPSQKVVFTGRPFRSYHQEPVLEVYKKLSTEWKKNIDQIRQSLNEFPLLLITGGGQGSHLINKNVALILSQLSEHYQVVVQTGDNQVFKDYNRLNKVKLKLTVEQQKRIWITKFLGRELALLLKECRLFVGRAGASFVYELGVFRVNSLLIPIPWVTYNEQFYNAEVLQKLKLANILPEKRLSPANLLSAIRQRIKVSVNGIDKKDLEKLFPINAAQKIKKQIKL